MTFVEVLSAAMDARDADEYTSRVKSAVIEALASLDPSTHIEDTQYFRHSAIPDLVLTWPKEKGSRAIFLRHSYQSIFDADDVEFLSTEEPVFMSLDSSDENSRSTEHVLEASVHGSRTMMTDPAAIDVIVDEKSTPSPLVGLVRANFIRGGKGLIDEERASTLISTAPTGPESEIRTNLISQSFSEDAAARITRTAQLMELALAKDVDTFESSPLVGGKLSIAELRHLFPWLLNQEAAKENNPFWRHLGEYVTFAELENIRTDLADLDLTPLIQANADRWSAKRAYIGLSTPLEGDDTYEKRSNFWSFHNGAALGIDIGEQRLSVADNGRLLKPRSGTSGATWDAISDALTRDRLSRIDLRGITRSVILTAERSPDIRSDIVQVTESLDDSYLVSQLAIRALAPEGEGTVDVEVDFDTAMTTSAQGAAISDLARISLQILNYRAPASDETLGTILSAVPPEKTALSVDAPEGTAQGPTEGSTELS